MSVLKECPYCQKEIDGRGYNSHVRACEHKEKIAEQVKENEQKLREENMDKTPQETPDTDPKNLKVPKLTKAIVSITGLITLVIIVILMLMFPKSKESKTNQAETSNKPRGHRLSR